MENNSKENIFLGKLELMLSKFNELDDIYKEISEMIKENPSNQQQIDYELSDYYHILEDTSTTDTEFINIGKKIQQARLIRKDYQCLYEIIKCYNENKDKLIWSPASNRAEFRKAIQYARRFLHEDYKYRILNEDDINNLKKEDIPKTEKLTDKLTKEKFEECIKNKMRNKDVAAYFGITESYVSHLKARYGLGTRKYKKRD